MEAYGLGPLPTGWECKLEPKISRIYFINHTSKTTTWEDPRLASIPTPPYHVAITQPTAYFEENVGSRWSSPVPSVRGFSLHRRGSSPRLGGSPRIAPSPTPPPRNKRNEPIIHFEPSTPLQNQRRSSISSILHPASSYGGPYNHQHVQLQDTTIPERPPSSYSTSSYNALQSSNLISCDSETAYRTVCALFPTALDTHIRHLFHKYHNRANLVASALQVEKYPFASELGTSLDISPKNQNGHHSENSNRDGDTDTLLSMPDTKSIGISSPMKGNSYATNSNSPARTGTPVSLLKFSNNQSSVGSLLTRSFGSPILSMSPQMQMVRENGKPLKSPKMKLKYMKGIFPAADETILLDVLSSCENNVQRASEKLMRKGFSRTPPPKPARQKWLEVKSLIEKRQRALDQQRFVNFQHEIRGEPQESPFPTPIMKTARPHPTAQEKDTARDHLVKNFPNLPDRFLSWALEAANFNKDKAERLLKEIGPQTPEEFKPFIATADQVDLIDIAAIVKELEMPSSATLNNNNNNIDKLKKSSSKQFRSVISAEPTVIEFETEKTPRKKNFLQNLFSFGKSDKAYITSNNRVKGPNSKFAKGANPNLLQNTYVQVRGPNAEVRKGPNAGYAAGPKERAQGANPSLAKGSIWFRNRHTQVQFVTVEG